MWIKSSGDLSENIYQIITAVSSNLVVTGEIAAIVDTSITSMHPHIIGEVSEIVGDPERLKYILLTHSHFDHIGGLPALRQYSPNAELVVSPALAAKLENKDLLEAALEKNKKAAEALGEEVDISLDDWCNAFNINRILGDGDTIPLGADVEMKLITCPGHVEDSTAYYVMPDSALIGDETLGSYYGRDKIACCFGTDSETYLESLDKLLGLEVKILGLPHGGALTGELAKKHLINLRGETERFQNHVKDQLEQGLLIDEIIAEILPEWKTQNICPEGPFLAEQESTLSQMVKVIADGV